MTYRFCRTIKDYTRFFLVAFLNWRITEYNTQHIDLGIVYDFYNFLRYFEIYSFDKQYVRFRPAAPSEMDRAKSCA